MMSCFPEAPKVTTGDHWNRYIAVVYMQPQVHKEIAIAGCEMGEKGAAIFRTCKACRIWADRQVPLTMDEKEEMSEAMLERDELDLRLDYANEEISKANRKRKVAQKNVEALLDEIWRLQVILSKTHIPKDVKKTYGVMYKRVIDDVQVPVVSSAIQHLSHLKSEGEVNPHRRRHRDPNEN